MKLGVPPSGSLPLAEQVSSVLVVTPLEGEIETESTLGSVLSTVTLSLLVTLAPALSVAVTVQVTVSPGWTTAVVRVSEVP